MAPRSTRTSRARARAALAPSRSDRADLTRARIILAAREAFADRGFEGASTREIASLAGANQGLITYHFSSKQNLWKAAVDSIFSELQAELADAAREGLDADPRSRLRSLVIRLVRFVARHPEQMRLMVQEGKRDGPRMKWLVDHHLRPFYALFQQVVGDARKAELLPATIPMPHLYYILIGAASTIFTAAPECKRLTGQDPMRAETIETHARAIVDLVLR